jgi:phosphatidylglycerol:prolipoprotein diacylglycerol transferase
MKPELFTIPGIDYGVKGYGFMLMIGFLTAIWWATHRAQKVKANPDLLLNIGFIALIFGVIGARTFYVIHYWEKAFTGRGLRAVLDVTAGGMEFYGGFLGALVFVFWYVVAQARPRVARALVVTWIAITVVILLAIYAALGGGRARFVLPVLCVVVGVLIVRALWRWGREIGAAPPVSLRLYLDVMTPSLMWGLAFGRIGCFLNGCCFGAPCQAYALPWAVRFPCGSPVQYHEWMHRETTLPAQLIYVDPQTGQGFPMPRELLTASPRMRMKYERKCEEAESKLRELQAADADPKRIAAAKHAVETAAKIRDEMRRLQRPFLEKVGLYNMKPSDIEQLARCPENESTLVHPTQLYAAVNAMLLALFLNAIFYRRKRHGVVFGLMWLCYPVTRIILEAIRADNPLDTGGLTISQAVSVGGFVFGVVWIVAMYRLPLRSPRAVPYVPPPAPKKA